MSNKIKIILDDLYALDPELKKYEAEIMKIIEEYLKAKPDSKFDKNFVAELRKEIMRRTESLKAETESTFSWLGNNMFYRFAYAAAGIIVLLLVAASLPFLYGQKPGARISLAPELHLSGGITKMADSAFGKLALNTSQNEQVRDSAALGLGGGGTMSAATKEFSLPSPIAPERINYEYVYQGDDFSVDQDKMPVYKRAANNIASRELGRYLTSFKLDALDIKKFSGADLNNLMISEDREFGYMLAINFQEGAIDINSNWQKWPRPEASCRDEACYQRYRLKIDDVPTDDKILAIAQQFVKDYGIDTKNYSQPYVQTGWKRYYGVTEDKANFYVPEDITVIYPLVLEGEVVHDEGGYPYGFYVSVNIRYGRVSGARPITPYNYVSSDYEVIKDKEKIMEYVNRGGIYPVYQYPDPTKTIKIELGTPEKGLVRYWNYNQDSGQGEELFVPALIFPVVKGDNDDVIYYNDYIVVPLVKEIIERQQENIIGIPMPTIKEMPTVVDDTPVSSVGTTKQ